MTMNFFIFDFQKHINFIESFLSSASKAHNQQKKTQEWFYWKFRDNPFGQSILACAEINGIISGCVAFGMQDFIYNHKVIKGTMSFETFVHPDYQGKGLFKKLIALAEEEAKSRRIQFLLNFPNSQSLPGFLRLNWSQLSKPEYWIRPIDFSLLILKFNDLRKDFIPNRSNLDELKLDTFNNYSCKNEAGFYSDISSKYLSWRFLYHPVAEYTIINDENCLAIARNGKRGSLNEIQILFIKTKNETDFSMKRLIDTLRQKMNAQIISMPISKNNRWKKYLRTNLFFKVPNRVNACYKILDDSLEIDIARFEFSAINFHTY